MIDIKGFFDVDHELMMRAVRAHTGEKMVLLYIERWLGNDNSKIDQRSSSVRFKKKGGRAGYGWRCLYNAGSLFSASGEVISIFSSLSRE